MSFINRRNAVVSWLTWEIAKRVLRHKLRAVAPGTVEGTRRPNKGAIAAGVAAAVGVLWFWHRSSSDDETPGES